MSILDDIVRDKFEEVVNQKNLVTARELEDGPFFNRTCLNPIQYIREKSGVIAEYKRKSPSKGMINAEVDMYDVFNGYQDNEASVISVLTDEKYFDGKLEYLEEARKTVDIPLLRKDFMVDEYQFLEAKAHGADLILLIAACLEPKRLQQLAHFAKSLGLYVLMEVHTQEELQNNIIEEVDLIGVNNRNLKTFEVSIQNSIELSRQIPDSYLKVAESGLKDAGTIRELKSHGFEAFLIGESFMRKENPGDALGQLVKGIA